MVSASNRLYRGRRQLAASVHTPQVWRAGGVRFMMRIHEQANWARLAYPLAVSLAAAVPDAGQLASRILCQAVCRAECAE